MLENKTMDEPIAGAVLASADLTSLLILCLIGMKTLTLKQGMHILDDLSDHCLQLSTANGHLPGQGTFFRQISARIESHSSLVLKAAAAATSVAG